MNESARSGYGRMRVLTAGTVVIMLALLVFAGAASALTKPGKPAAKSPAGSITATKVTFTWGKAAGAKTYEVRVYEGATVRLKKTGVRGTTWKSTTALATGVGFTWKVRARNAAGTGRWSAAKAFTIAFVAPVAIGDDFGGGKVAYVVQKGDAGFDPNIQHGLIAATADQSDTNAVWTDVRTDAAVGPTGTGLFTGARNTDLIITAQGTGYSYAALIARNYAGGGFTDWYLPSKDELNKLYLAKDAVGGFQKATYWSSSHYDGPTVWVQFFEGGAQNHQWRQMRGTVRAVRSF